MSENNEIVLFKKINPEKKDLDRVTKYKGEVSNILKEYHAFIVNNAENLGVDLRGAKYQSTYNAMINIVEQIANSRLEPTEDFYKFPKNNIDLFEYIFQYNIKNNGYLQGVYK